MTTRTQFNAGAGGEICDVVIGLDFGTSCTKVVIRTPYHYGGRAFAVPFDAGHATCKYLLPSALWLDGDRVALPRTKNASLLRDIKLHLMKPDAVPEINGRGTSKRHEAKAVAVSFLALTLRTAREWFLNHQQTLYGKYRLRWTLNIGLPSGDFADTTLCNVYDEIARAAWCLSVTKAPPTLSQAQEMLSHPENCDHVPEEAWPDDISSIPEVAAEVAGYARSRMRQEGLHMLVDVGASTLDVCGFILHETDEGDGYALLTSDVKVLGATILYQHRVSGVRRAVDDHMARLWDEYDPVSAMSDDPLAYAPCHDAIGSSIEEFDKKYQTACRQMIWKTIVDLKTKRDPNSDRWRTAMPLFMSGGGSAMRFYQQSLDLISDHLRSFYQGCSGIRRLSLAKPDNLDAVVDDHTYHRLAVAWGLSFPETDIGEVSRPDDIRDIDPKEVIDWRKGFISKEMV